MGRLSERRQELRPELERVDGFIDNIRYKSLTREGWTLSLSGWRDEKAVVRWRRRSIRPQVRSSREGVCVCTSYR
jgi:heme-degrading monooxygenase HmoA